MAQMDHSSREWGDPGACCLSNGDERSLPRAKEEERGTLGLDGQEQADRWSQQADSWSQHSVVSKQEKHVMRETDWKLAGGRK